MNYYNEISKAYDELHSQEQIKKARIIADGLSPEKNESLLDVGCGPGTYLDIFDCEVVGVDPSQELLSKYKGQSQVLEMSAEELDFEDNSFDYVISITAIHNFQDIERGLDEMKRVGKKKFAFSILKRSPSHEKIIGLIEKKFEIESRIEEDKDTIMFCLK